MQCRTRKIDDVHESVLIISRNGIEIEALAKNLNYRTLETQNPNTYTYVFYPPKFIKSNECAWSEICRIRKK